jgi:hypothetical protein
VEALGAVSGDFAAYDLPAGWAHAWVPQGAGEALAIG